MPEIIDPVFAKTSQYARFLLSENERFGLVFVKTGSINSGTVVSSFLWLVLFLLLRTFCCCWRHGVASIQAVAHVPTVAEVLIDAVCCVPSVVGVCS